MVAQYFEVQVYDQFAIRGNAAIFKCQVPSFVADHVDVVGWIDSNGGSYVADEQSYGSQKWKDARCIVFLFFFCKLEGHRFSLEKAQITKQENWLDHRVIQYNTFSFFLLSMPCIMFLCFKRIKCCINVSVNKYRFRVYRYISMYICAQPVYWIYAMNCNVEYRSRLFQDRLCDQFSLTNAETYSSQLSFELISIYRRDGDVNKIPDNDIFIYDILSNRVYWVIENS